MTELTTFWHVWVTVIVIGSMIACGILLTLTYKNQKYNEETDQTTGHSFDGIDELDNPLPKWWMWFFWSTIVFGVFYIGVYGIGDWKGYSNWSSHGQWQAEMDKAEKKYAPYYAKLNAMSVEELAQNKDALATGQRIFTSNCALCHGSTATGALGFPNLTDNDWLYGGKGDTIKQTIMHGRTGMMPANGLKPDLTATGRSDIAAHVLSLSGRTGSGDPSKGKKLFAQACAACHGAKGTGMQSVGAPNLTDNIWLYGGSQKQIEFTIEFGRAGVMPAWKEILGEDKVHALAGYVYSLSLEEPEEQK